MDKWVYASRFVGVGFFIAGAIIGGLILGFWLDSKFGKTFFWIIGLLLGIIVAVVGVYRMLIPLLNDNNSKNNHKRGS